MKKILLLWMLCLLVVGRIMAAGAADSVRNVIFMIGDGMGLGHVSLLTIEDKYAPTAFNRAQGVALISTYSANNRVTDSAAAATALATGTKTNNSTLGLDPDGNRLQSLMAKAVEQGRPTGIVVCCYLQHATPAGFYAHVTKRGETEAITRDLLASNIDVLIGGGRKWLSEECDEGDSYFDAFVRKGYFVANSLDETENLHSGRLLGVVAEKHLPDADKRGDYLPCATEKALEILTNDADSVGRGFVLMVEGSLIDGAAHANDAERVLGEMRDFEHTVAVAMDFADQHPGTLVIVTADHETGGLTIPSNKADFTQSESGLQYAFSTKGHTGTLVPVYLYGTGADQITGVMDNTQLSRRIMTLLGQQ